MSHEKGRPKEELLRAAFEREGAAHDVDVVGLYAATRARVSPGASPASEPVWGAAWGGWLVAAGVVLAASVAGFAVAFAPTTTDGNVAEEPSSAGRVDQTFSCPVQGTTDFGSDDDESFLPELSPDGLPSGEASGAPLHEVVVREDRATLRLGNADGTLASSTTFARTADGYRRLSVTKCTNEPTTDAASEPLVSQGLRSTPSDLRSQDVAPSAVLVADRLTYDVSGLEKRITAYAYPCGVRVCIDAGSRNGTISMATLPKTPAPEDLTALLADPDDVVGIEPTQRLIAVHDREDNVNEVSWSDTSGTSTIVPVVQGGTWQGGLYLLLVPSETFDALQIQSTDGATVFSADNLRS